MMYCHYKRDLEKEFLFRLDNGNSCLRQSIEMIKPLRIGKKGLAFSLLNNGRLISKFYSLTDSIPNAAIGGFKGNSLILFLRGRETITGLDLFNTDIPVGLVRRKLLEGELNEALFLSRMKWQKSTK
jgi:hypothetical protein